MMRFPQLVLCLLITVISLAQAKSAQATIIGFSYLANINFRQVVGAIPQELDPLRWSTEVFGSYYFDSATQNTSQEPSIGFYENTLPFVSGAHFLRWHVGPSIRPPEVSFQDTGVSIFNDWPIPNNPPLPEPEHMDSYSVGSNTLMHVSGQSDLTAILGSVYFIYSSIGPITAPSGPFDSIALPLTPPVLKDFTDGHYWEFNLQKFGSDGWRINLIGDVVMLKLAAAPEPSSQWLSLIGLLSLLLFQQRKRHNNQ
ncbi:MAG: hypothetical protein E6Q61_04715 [Nitrosomonas sp.]|nr:MAG: hypothetical protein E6Q61_04715 [Nitrosomonas sp.]